MIFKLRVIYLRFSKKENKLRTASVVLLLQLNRICFIVEGAVLKRKC